MFFKIRNRGINLTLSFSFTVLAVLVSNLLSLLFIGWILDKPEFSNKRTVTVDYKVQYGCFYMGNQTPSVLIGTYQVILDNDHPRGSVVLPITEPPFGGYFILPFTQDCALKMYPQEGWETSAGLYCDKMVNVPFYQTNIKKISTDHFQILAQPNGHGKLPWKYY